MNEIIDLKNKLLKHNIILNDAMTVNNSSKNYIIADKVKEAINNTRRVKEILKEECFSLELEILESNYVPQDQIKELISTIDIMLNALISNNHFMIESLIFFEKMENFGNVNNITNLESNVMLKNMLSLYLSNLIFIKNHLDESKTFNESDVYMFVFSDSFSRIVNDICDIARINKDYYDPDSSYSDDSRAFIDKVESVKDELKIIDN